MSPPFPGNKRCNSFCGPKTGGGARKNVRRSVHPSSIPENKQLRKRWVCKAGRRPQKVFPDSGKVFVELVRVVEARENSMAPGRPPDVIVLASNHGFDKANQQILDASPTPLFPCRHIAGALYLVRASDRTAPRDELIGAPM